MQVCPAFKNLAQIKRLIAVGKSALGAMMAGLLPPSSKVTGVRCLAAASYTMRPTAGLPVKKILSKRSASSVVVSSTPPNTTVKRRGSKYCATSSAIHCALLAASSEGFRTTVLPAANAAIAGANDS